MVYPNLNWVHINSFNLWDARGAYTDIHDVDPSYCIVSMISIGSSVSGFLGFETILSMFDVIFYH
jgi:hypothetical protein